MSMRFFKSIDISVQGDIHNKRKQFNYVTLLCLSLS